MTKKKENTMEKKVFCIKCKYSGRHRGEYFCCHPNNMKDTFYEEKSGYIENPSSKNIYNNCQDYVDAELERAREQVFKDAEKFQNRKWFEFWK